MRFIRIDVNNMVVSTRVGEEIVDGEVESKLGECGQIMQPDGTFVTPEQPEPGPTIAEQMQALREDNLILMDAIAAMFEEILILRGETL